MVEPEQGAASSAEASDGSLVRRFRRGGTDAATLLYFRYADQLYSLTAARLATDLAARLDPDDIVQSVFRTFFRRAKIGQYDVPEGEDLWKLFLVIALNKIRSAGTHHRAARRDVGRTVEGGADVLASAGEVAHDHSLRMLQWVVEDLLGRLPPECRPVIERRIDGYEVAEIASALGRSKRSVERILRHFREELNAALHEE